MNSMPAAAQAAAMRAQPSTVSWSVSAMHGKPSLCACPTSSSGVNVPSENCVCRWQVGEFHFTCAPAA